ncbi:MAG: hypothetical protein AAF653_00635 [Chloroflexota bacterium]
MRPPLNEHLTPEAFNEFRWLKAELIDFCKARGLPTDGNKHRIRKQVAGYLAAQRTIDRDRRRRS